MPTFMDATNTIRRSDDAPPPQGIDYGNLRKQVIIALIEKMATQDPEERAAKLNLMGAQAEHERGLAHAATNNPKYDTPEQKVDEAKRVVAATRNDPESAKNELFGAEFNQRLDNEIEHVAAGLGQNFDASKVEPQVQRVQNENLSPFTGVSEDVLRPIKDAIREKIWAAAKKRGFEPRTAKAPDRSIFTLGPDVQAYFNPSRENTARASGDRWLSGG